ncbi:MAG: DUF4173 domain-containing protein [Pseudomonadota bacterium]
MTMKREIRGLPRALARDAWWFGADAPTADPNSQGKTAGTGHRAGRPIFIVIALVAFADFLFWHHDAGLSLSVFAVSVFAAVAAGQPWRKIWRPLVLLAVTVLPAVEYVQTLSVLFLALGLVGAVAWIRVPATCGLGGITGRAVALILAIPWQGPRDLMTSFRRIGMTSVSSRPQASVLLRQWGLPIGGTAILVSLLMDANPILAGWLSDAFDLRVDWTETAVRTLFWGGIATTLWPLVSLGNHAQTAPQWAPQIRLPAVAGFNAGSVLRALFLFNIVLGVQTVMDAALLWGGGELPDGMGYAEYAHRGAYPLLATALLAGAFALAARPFLDESRLLRPLVLLWLLQNVALCVSSAKRLALYVDAFGLTYLRLYVMIWIAVVAIGLCLTAWQIWSKRPNRWLLIRSVVLGLGVLYLASFVNFAQIIATQNLSNTGRPVDWTYLARLPDIVNPSIRASEAFAELDGDPFRYQFFRFDRIDNWRDWGFRRWRVEDNMTNAEPN